MAREPVRFTAPHPDDCQCVYCRAWRDAPTGPVGQAARRPRTPEDGQRINTPEGGRPVTTRED